MPGAGLGPLGWVDRSALRFRGGVPGGNRRGHKLQGKDVTEEARCTRPFYAPSDANLTQQMRGRARGGKPRRALGASSLPALQGCGTSIVDENTCRLAPTDGARSAADSGGGRRLRVLCAL